jgi:hypothetical protein
MNTRLRNSLSALVLAASVTSLGYVLGEPPRPGSLVAGIGSEAVSAVTLGNDAERSTEAGRAAGARSPHAMPFFSFGRRAAVGAP